MIERTVNFWAGKDETAGNGIFFSIVGILVVNGKAWSAVAKNNANDLNGRSKKIYGCEVPRIMTIIVTGGWWATLAQQYVYMAMVQKMAML